MADKKSKAEAASRKAAPVAADQRAASATQSNSEMQRLLREAAWARMFGKAAGPKNPFAR